MPMPTLSWLPQGPVTVTKLAAVLQEATVNDFVAFLAIVAPKTAIVKKFGTLVALWLPRPLVHYTREQFCHPVNHRTSSKNYAGHQNYLSAS